MLSLLVLPSWQMRLISDNGLSCHVVASANERTWHDALPQPHPSSLPNFRHVGGKRHNTLLKVLVSGRWGSNPTLVAHPPQASVSCAVKWDNTSIYFIGLWCRWWPSVPVCVCTCKCSLSGTAPGSLLHRQDPFLFPIRGPPGGFGAGFGVGWKVEVCGVE